MCPEETPALKKGGKLEFHACKRIRSAAKAWPSGAPLKVGSTRAQTDGTSVVVAGFDYEVFDEVSQQAGSAAVD